MNLVDSYRSGIKWFSLVYFSFSGNI